MPNQSVLCIDDDSFYRDLFETVLSAKGFSVRTAATPQEGLQAIAAGRPDVIMLDVMMPESDGVLDGFAFLDRLKVDPVTAGIPVVMISSLGEAEDIERGMRGGAAAYMPKHEMTPDILAKILTDTISQGT